MNQQTVQILMLSNYYLPETASLAQLSANLCHRLADHFDVCVICSVPSYTGIIQKKYLKKMFFHEEHNGVKVIRMRVPRFDKKNKASRITNVLSYSMGAIIAIFKAPKADIIIAQSQPPILNGVLGVICKWINRMRGKKAKLVYVIQDYNPEQTIAIGYVKNPLIIKIAMLLDKFSCRIANKVVVVGSDMISTMVKRFTDKNGKISKHMPRTVFINNWMDEKDVYPLPKDNHDVLAFKHKYGLEKKFVIMYSGNIGLYYDLLNIMKVIERFRHRKDVAFAFVGDGVVKNELITYVQTHDMDNVVFIPYQNKKDLVYSLNAADVHWVVNAKGIKGISCPSKLYGILAAAKPSLAVLEEGTEARTLIEKTRCGYAVSPEDYDGIEALIEQYIDGISQSELIEMGTRGYEYMKQYLSKDISLEKYRQEILSC